MTSEEFTEIDLNEQLLLRRQKLQALREQGQPFPDDFQKNAWAEDLCEQFGHCSEAELESTTDVVKIAGRMMTRRLMGKASFVHIQDMSGRIQLYVKQDNCRLKSMKHLNNGIWAISLGEGVLFKTKTGELSIHVETLQLLTKALRPLPDKFHGLTDQEMRYRQRYLDLIANEETQTFFKFVLKSFSRIREFLNAQSIFRSGNTHDASHSGWCCSTSFYDAS